MSICARTKHRPGPEVTDGPDAYAADCTVCGLKLWTWWSDNDGDGVGHWTRWGPAPVPVVVLGFRSQPAASG